MMGPGSAASLAQSLGLLHANHRRWHPYKVLVFAPQDVRPGDLAELRVRATQPCSKDIEQLKPQLCVAGTQQFLQQVALCLRRMWWRSVSPAPCSRIHPGPNSHDQPRL